MANIRFIINRFDGQREYRQEYEVDCQPGLTLLSALIKIREELDPTLDFTASCRSAICGACAVRVEGSPFLACDTRVDDLVACFGTATLTVGPIGNYPVISDLVVDWEAKLSRLASVKPGLIPQAAFSAAEGCRQSPADFQRLRLMWDCILCGCCASECGKLSYGQADFNEPYVYTHARRYVEDSRDRSPLAHAVPTLDKDGLWKCIHCMQCVTNCPKHLEPAEDISRLREFTVAAGYDDRPGPRHAKAFAADLETTGRLNEAKMALRTEGMLKTLARLPFALRMLARGKLDPLAVFHSKAVEGQPALCRILKASKEADKR